MNELIWSNEWLEEIDDVSIIEDSLKELGKTLADYVVNNIGGDEYLLIRSSKVDWTGKSGYKKISLWDKDNLELAREVIPEYDNIFRLYKEDDGSLYAVVSSHDIPTGSAWDFIPMKDVEAVMQDIYDGCIGDGLDYLERRMNTEFGINISLLSKEDVTKDHNVDEGVTVYSYGGGMLLAWVSDGVIDDIDYIEDSIEESYMEQL